MSQLAKLGAFSVHLSAQGGRFGNAILATAKISETCGTTGFCHGVIRSVLCILTSQTITP